VGHPPYDYEISGRETEESMNAKVEMLPSLDVKITARPVKPTVMYQKQSSPATPVFQFTPQPGSGPLSLFLPDRDVNATTHPCPSGQSGCSQ
jgi:hypothetical protein